MTCAVSTGVCGVCVLVEWSPCNVLFEHVEQVHCTLFDVCIIVVVVVVVVVVVFCYTVVCEHAVITV